jgi:hypothetical protein
MILEEDQVKSRIEKLQNQVEFEKKLIEMAEPFQMLIENEYFKKVQSYYEKSADIYQKKIQSLNNDLVSDGVEMDGGIPENPVFHQLRIASVIAKAVVARETLLSFVNEPKQIIERAKLSLEKIDKITKEISELEENKSNG